jgi:hypothetical protein
MIKFLKFSNFKFRAIAKPDALLGSPSAAISKLWPWLFMKSRYSLRSGNMEVKTSQIGLPSGYMAWSAAILLTAGMVNSRPKPLFKKLNNYPAYHG